MQPQRAPRGIAAVAVSTAALGLLLLALAFVLSACGSSAASKPTTTAATGSSAATTPSATPPATTSATAGTSAPATSPAATTPADPDTGVVPSVPVTTAPAVPITATASAAAGGRITIGTITSLEGEAQLPGERNGPAVRVPVTITNGSAGALDLSQVVVDLVDASGVSAGQLSAAPAAPFDGSLAPGATASAVYVFSLATDDRTNVKIIVSYTTKAPVVVFAGSIA